MRENLSAKQGEHENDSGKRIRIKSEGIGCGAPPCIHAQDLIEIPPRCGPLHVCDSPHLTCQSLWSWELEVVEEALEDGDDAALTAAAELILSNATLYRGIGPSALTVKQPYARALMWKIKDIENRGFALRLPAEGQVIKSGIFSPEANRGKWIGLHAGAGTDLLANPAVLASVSGRSGIPVQTWLEGIKEEMGVLLGAMLITNVSENTIDETSPWAHEGLYGWKVEKVVTLAKPVPISGRLGMWPLPSAIRLLLALHIREQMCPRHAGGRALPASSRAQMDALVSAALQQRREQELEIESRRKQTVGVWKILRELLLGGGGGEAVDAVVEVSEAWLLPHSAGATAQENSFSPGEGQAAPQQAPQRH